MGAGTRDGVDGDVVGARLEGDAVVLVGDADVGEGDVGSWADVPAVRVLGQVGGGRCRCEGDG